MQFRPFYVSYRPFSQIDSTVPLIHINPSLLSHPNDFHPEYHPIDIPIEKTQEYIKSLQIEDRDPKIDSNLQQMAEKCANILYPVRRENLHSITDVWSQSFQDWYIYDHFSKSKQS